MFIRQDFGESRRKKVVDSLLDAPQSNTALDQCQRIICYDFVVTTSIFFTRGAVVKWLTMH